MSGYIPWRIIIVLVVMGIAAAICFVLSARKMGGPDDFDDLH